MDSSIIQLKHAVKQAAHQVNMAGKPSSFTVVTGKIGHGITTLLKQSQLEPIHQNDETDAEVYINGRGIVVALGEKWLVSSNHLLKDVLDALSKAASGLAVTGVILCVDINDCITHDPTRLSENYSSILNILARFKSALTPPIDLAIILTKTDYITGFNDFFSQEESQKKGQPLGFSFHTVKTKKQLVKSYQKQFDHLVEKLGQQVINKLHPVRSHLKRTLIREFPLQIAALKKNLQALIQKVPLDCFSLQALYLTSAEQGGHAVDQFTTKINHEYALVVSDNHIQATNHQAHFIDGAIGAFQAQTSVIINKQDTINAIAVTLAITATIVACIGFAFNYWHASQSMEKSQQALNTFVSSWQHNKDSTSAMYFLQLASDELDAMPNHSSTKSFRELKQQIHLHNKHMQAEYFIPYLLSCLEKTMTAPETTPSQKYSTLKVYLMLGDKNRFDSTEVKQWFKQHWQNVSLNKQHTLLNLLNKTLVQPMQPININANTVQDTRNYLNALPQQYLLFELAKNALHSSPQSLSIQGFRAPSSIPSMFTKANYTKTYHQIKQVAQTLETESWVLNQTPEGNVYDLLVDAYADAYVSYWKQFMQRVSPDNSDTTRELQIVIKSMQEHHSIATLINLMQDNTKPYYQSEDKTFKLNNTCRF